MPRAASTCSTPGCPNLTSYGSNRCTQCQRQADTARGTATQRGYDKQHRRFRRHVLERDALCVLCGTGVATVADHYPKSRRQLVAEGLNPNDPRHGRGLCKRCHDQQTAIHQPGGWNQRD